MIKEVLDSKLNRLKLESKLKKLKEKIGFVVQSLLFPISEFSIDSAKKWANTNGFKDDKAEKTGNFIHIRQKSPNRFNTYKTVLIGENVKARVAGNFSSKFSGSVSLKGFSKFSANVKSELDLKIPMEVDMMFLCEGKNRDGNIKREDLEISLDLWRNLPIIDWHDMTDMKHPTNHKITDRKGFLGKNPTIVMRDGKQWIKSTAFITDRYLAYLIYLADNSGNPLEISPEYGWTPYWVGGEKNQANINPHLITIVDKGHIEGNKIILKE